MRRVLVALFFAVPLAARALSPAPEANRAFDRYAEQAERGMQSGHFLYADTHAEARARAYRGETVVVELRDANVKIPSGAVHDWLGVAFFPATDIARVRAILEDYPDYKRIYAPDVRDSRQLAHTGASYHIALDLENRQFLTLHYDSEYDVLYSAAAADRLEVVSRSSSIRQQGGDDGFLWRLNSYWRLEEADGGVYAECRAISLSRPVPAVLGWLRGAIEKFPRDSMVRTLEATKRAAAK